MNRIRAFTIHLLISASIGATLFALFWYVWYPEPLFKAVGGLEIFSMLLAIDVVLGPLLTLIVFKAGKKSLKWDLSIIAAVQIAAMCYGVFTLMAGRPVYVAAVGSRFDVVTANEVDPLELQVSGKQLPLFGPEWIGTRRSSDPKEDERVAFAELGGASYGFFPQHHAPLSTMADALRKNSQPIATLLSFNPGREDEIHRWLTSRGYREADAVFQPLRARGQSMTVMVEASTGNVIGAAPFKSWK